MSIPSTRVSLKLEEAIRQELPEHLSIELRKMLEEGEKARLDFETQKAILAAAHDETRVLKEQVKTLTVSNEAWQKHANDLVAREQAVRMVETELMVAKLKQTCAEEKAQDLKEIVSLVFRSPVFSSTVSDNKSTSGAQYVTETGHRVIEHRQL